MIVRKNRSARLFKLVLFIVLVACLSVIFRQEYSIYKIKKEQASVKQNIRALQEEQRKMQQERKMLEDSRYIEKIAREDYNMVGKDEVPLFIVDEKK